jgi:RNA polymerase sigma factor (sigma-70 family)
MSPPPATSYASRLFAGAALRTQSDRRLVSLVREGYENAFDEIVRRYGKPLVRYAAAIVTANRAEDVTQDAFSKALLALRDTDKEIELRPWLYRIVRNTALNDLRDQPPPTAQLHEQIDGVETPLDAAERREEINELVQRLRALPDPQRAAIVMRELEGLSHEEIAAALGMTGGAARQAIHRARRKLRDGAGLLLPIPLLQYLLAPSAESLAAGAGVGGAAAGGVAAGGGAGMALKAGVASVLVAGSVGTGVALHESRSGKDSARAAETPAQVQSGGGQSGPSVAVSGDDSGTSEHRGGHGSGRRGENEPGDNRGKRGHHKGEGEGRDDSGSHGGPGPSSSSGPGPGGSDDDASGGDDHSGRSGGGHSGSDSSGSGSSGSGSPDSGSGSSGSGSSGSGSGSSGSGSGNSGSGGSGSPGDDDPLKPLDD